MQGFPQYPLPGPSGGASLPMGYDAAWYQPAPVTHGMTPPPQVDAQRVRWGRIVLAFAGAALLAFAAANMISAANIAPARSDASRDISASAGDGGASAGSEADVAGDAGSSGEVLGDPAAAAGSGGTTDSITESVPQTSGSGMSTTDTHARHRTGTRRKHSSGSRRSGRRAAGGGAALQGATETANAGGRHPRGGGRAVAAGSALPKTGASVWIAAFLGIALLGGGVLMQVHAVRIAATALLYRRGPLLRPSWYAVEGLPMAASAAESLAPRLGRLLQPLERLLRQPPAESEFVGWRRRS